MKKMLAIALATAGALYLAAPATAAPASEGLTRDLSAATVKKVVVKKKGHTTVRRTTVRHYEAPKYYGYYGPTYYERPYSRPPGVVFGIGGWW
jgi:hypothetical protein